MKKMQRWISALLVLAMAATLLPLPAAAEDTGDGPVLALPAQLTTVEPDAFSGDTNITTLIIPKTVESIGEKAFADCTGLQEVIFGNNAELEIAPDAFDGCGDVQFTVFPQTSASLYAMSHGYDFELMEDGSEALDRAMAMVAAYTDSESTLQSDCAPCRLIVKRTNGKLPDISAMNPAAIVFDDNLNINGSVESGLGLFYIQFDNAEDALACQEFLLTDSCTQFAELDQTISAQFDIDEVSAAGVMDPTVWDNSDPMEFERYAAYLRHNGNGGTVTIAVIDSGVEPAATTRLVGGKNFVNDGLAWNSDPRKHGSVVANIISDCAGAAASSIRILSVRAFDTKGKTTPLTLGNAIRYAIEQGADVINLSAAMDENYYSSASVDSFIELANSKGCSVVVAAGNYGLDAGSFWPARNKNVITVAGSSPNNTLLSGSNYGSCVNYAAPGTCHMPSQYPTRLSSAVSTSFAAPMISTALAMLRLDSYHDLNDLNASCIEISSPAHGSAGYGMPKLGELAKLKVKNITLTEDLPTQLAVGQQTLIRWSITPENATDKQVNVTCTDENVVQVIREDNGGISLLPVAQGTCTIRLASNDGGAAIEKTVTVVMPATGITISGGKDTINLTQTLQLRAVVTPADVTNGAVRWVSTNTAVAEVSETGLVTPKSIGTCGIYAEAVDGYGARSETLSLNVVERPNPESISVLVDGLPLDGNTIRIAPNATRVITFGTNPVEADQAVNTRVIGSHVTLRDGVLTGVSSGESYILVTTPYGKVEREITVNVIVGIEKVTITVDNGVEVDNFTTDEGTTFSLAAKVIPDNATDRTVIWSSLNENVATVSATGKVTAKMEGSAVIKATSQQDSGFYDTITVNVLHPYTIEFNLMGTDDAPARLSTTATVTARSGSPIGFLPTATRDYNTFDGWYTSPVGGTKVTESYVHVTDSNYLPLYAHWKSNATSNWVLPSAVPSGAKVVQTGYSYRESTESESSSLSGYTKSGFRWQQVSTGWSYYASFPSGFDTGNTLYKNYMKAPFTASETETTKRTVTTARDGWIYWHWMYNVTYASGTTRAIYNKKGTGPSTNFAYNYFYAIASTTDCPYLDKNYCNSQNIASYNCKSIIPSNADKSSKSGLGTDRFFRFDRNKSTYTDYKKIYQFYRDVSYAAQDPGTASNISNKVTYVKYIAK